MPEEKKEDQEETKKGEIKVERVLACGHVDSFEHRLANGLLDIVEMHLALRADPTDSMMEFIRRVFDHCYLTIPTVEELNRFAKAAASYTQEAKQ